MHSQGRSKSGCGKNNLTQHEKDLRDGTINGKKPKSAKFSEPAPAAPAPGVTRRLLRQSARLCICLRARARLLKASARFAKTPLLTEIRGSSGNCGEYEAFLIRTIRFSEDTFKWK
jgi:hypothetical protein